MDDSAAGHRIENRIAPQIGAQLWPPLSATLSVSVPIRRRQSGRSWHELSSIYTKRQEALQYMRKAIVLFALSIAVCGCNKQGGQPRLESLERGLAEAWQPVALDMKLDIHPEANGEQVTMHCVLRNISANEIDVDQESLPWNNADAFSVSAVTADGEVIQQKPVAAPAVIARIGAPHAPVPLASG